MTVGISLFGLSSEADVYGSVLAKTFPELSNRKKLGEWAKDKNISLFGFGIPFGGAVAYALDVTVRENVDQTKVLIFDDLERSSIEYQKLFGVINFYVEQHGCRVVVLAHDDKIVEQFKQTKEKVFGHTVRIKPKITEAFAIFVGRLGQNTQQVLGAHHSLLLELFALSECQSLRVLKQALAGLERVCKLLDAMQLANAAAMKRILSLHFTISIEVLRGDLGREDLVERVKSHNIMWSKIRNDKGENEETLPPSPFAVSYQRYSNLLELTNYDLSDELLVNMIVDGHYDKSQLQKYLINSEIFEQSKEWPAWRRFIYFRTQPDSVVNEAALEMDRQFKSREITDIGELMHVVSLRIMRVKEKLIDGSRDEIVEDTIKYLNDLVDQSRFPLEPNVDVFGSFPAHGGVTLWGHEENQDVFKKIRDHVFKCEERILQNSSNNIKIKILSAMKSSAEDLSALLTYSPERAAEYQRIPALLSLSPQVFVNAFLELPLERWDALQKVMGKRYSMISQNNTLSKEGDWFRQVEAEMVLRSDQQKGTINALRIKMYIPRRN